MEPPKDYYLTICRKGSQKPETSVFRSPQQRNVQTLKTIFGDPLRLRPDQEEAALGYIKSLEASSANSLVLPDQTIISFRRS